MTNTGRTLFDFVKNYCDYLSTADLQASTSSSSRALHGEKCAICLTILAESAHRVVQINLPGSCDHALDEDCFARYILAGYHSCPYCRAEWYNMPDGVTTNIVSMALEAVVQQSVREVHDALLDLRPFSQIRHRPGDNDNEIVWLSSLNRNSWTNTDAPGPVGGGALFEEWPDWLDEEGDVDVAETPSRPLGRRHRRQGFELSVGDGGAHDYRRGRSGHVGGIGEHDVIETSARSVREGAPAPGDRTDNARSHDGSTGWVDQEGDVDGL
jgi:hypothetical protein